MGSARGFWQTGQLAKKSGFAWGFCLTVWRETTHNWSASRRRARPTRLFPRAAAVVGVRRHRLGASPLAAERRGAPPRAANHLRPGHLQQLLHPAEARAPGEAGHGEESADGGGRTGRHRNPAALQPGQLEERRGRRVALARRRHAPGHHAGRRAVDREQPGARRPHRPEPPEDGEPAPRARWVAPGLSKSSAYSVERRCSGLEPGGRRRVAPGGTRGGVGGDSRCGTDRTPPQPAPGSTRGYTPSPSGLKTRTLKHPG